MRRPTRGFPPGGGDPPDPPSSYQFLPLLGQGGGLPQLPAEPQPLQLQGHAGRVEGHGPLRHAQLLLHHAAVRRPPALRQVRLAPAAEHRLALLILGKEGGGEGERERERVREGVRVTSCPTSRVLLPQAPQRQGLPEKAVSR